MPVFLEAPSYPRGPDGQGWNRLNLSAHFDIRHQCGLRPTTYATLFDSMTGRQGWGGYLRCPERGPGHCPTCPIQRAHLDREGVDWPARTPLLLVRVRPLPPTPGALFADPAAGRSTLHLQSWRGKEVDVDADWQSVRNTPHLRLGRAYFDDEGQAFWLVRHSPSAASAIVRSRQFASHTRHALYGGAAGKRLALLTCHGGCAHEDWHLQQLAADLSDSELAPAPAEAPEIPARLPAVPGIEFAVEDGCTVLSRSASRDYASSTTHVSWNVPLGEAAVTALLAHAVRLTA